ncbi:hypothetical protein RIF29_21043 [Crotalaria pallida]|uniref:Uncharacterized protein n=1 Tax=Crotalaria pallida TaxID=3830 RepID=A0AAN9I960_CROPI
MSSSQNYSKNDRKRSSNWEASSLFDSASSYNNRGFEAMPSYCACGGVRDVLQTTRTQEHYGFRFWGCRFYKMEMESIQKDLEFIKKDLDFIQKDLESSKRWIKILVVICI